METSKLSDKKNKKELAELKDIELEIRLSNLKCNNNYNNNYNNNNNFGGRTSSLLSPPPPLSRALDKTFDPFAGATVLLPSPPRTEPSVPPFQVRYLHRQIIIPWPVIGVIPRVSEVEPSVPELPPEDQIRVSPTLRRTYPELSDEEDENKPPRPEFTISNLNEIRDALNDGEIHPELEFFNGGQNLRSNKIVNNLGINLDSRDFLNFLQDDICQGLIQRNRLSIHIETGNIYYDNFDTRDSIYSFFYFAVRSCKKTNA